MTITPFALIPMTRKEVYTALSMSRTDFYRKTRHLRIPARERIVPEDLLEICENLRRNPKVLEDYLLRYSLLSV